MFLQNVFALFYFHNIFSMANHPFPRNWSFRWAFCQSWLARILLTFIIIPLADLNLCNKVSMPTMPFSSPLAKWVLGKIQAIWWVVLQKRTLTFFKWLYVWQTWLGYEKLEDNNVCQNFSNISLGNLSMYEIVSMVVSRGKSTLMCFEWSLLHDPCTERW